jgi:alpha-aminoadipate/glutamate carrier protein LysW
LKSKSSQLFIKRRLEMNAVACPECVADITLENNTEVGEIIVCPDCGVDLEVTALEPASVGLAPMEEEDWGE